MPAHALPPTARLITPRRSLASCVRAYVVRDTTCCAPLPAQQRLNHFPATPLCSLNWFIEGAADCAPTPGEPVQRAHRFAFRGPQRGPTVTYNPGPVRGFKLLLFPQALHALTGIPMAEVVDRTVPADQVLPDAWLGMMHAVLHAPCDESRVQCIEAFLEPRWRMAQEQGRTPPAPGGDWVEAVTRFAAAEGGGSVRSLERRIRASVGIPLRRLRGLQRAELAFRYERQEVQRGATGWADYALRGGYADQAHLCRETRRITGHSPAELLRKSLSDESHWLYRIWA